METNKKTTVTNRDLWQLLMKDVREAKAAALDVFFWKRDRKKELDKEFREFNREPQLAALAGSQKAEVEKHTKYGTTHVIQRRINFT